MQKNRAIGPTMRIFPAIARLICQGERQVCGRYATSHSAYVATSNELGGVKIDGYPNFKSIPHCKYISRNYYDNLSCPYSHRNLVIVCTVNGSNLDYSPWTAISTLGRPKFF